MSNKRPRLVKVPTWFVILGTLMLMGVLSMAYGYYQGINILVYIGVVVTFLGALNGLILLATRSDKPRVVRRLH